MWLHIRHTIALIIAMTEKCVQKTAKKRSRKFPIYRQAEIIQAAFLTKFKKWKSYACPFCAKRKNGAFVLEHLASFHVNSKLVLERLSPTVQKKVGRLRRRRGKRNRMAEKIRKGRLTPVKRSSENKQRDQERSNRSVLDPDSVKAGGSNVVWATSRRSR